MSALTDKDTAIPTSDSLFRLNGNTQKLQQKLQESLAIGTPSQPDETPPSLFFERKRDIEIPWKKVFHGMQGPVEESVDALRIDLERSVGLRETPLDLLEQEDVDAVFKYYTEVDPGSPAPQEAPQDPAAVFRSKFNYDAAVPAADGKPATPASISVTGDPIKEKCIVFHHGSGRLYRLIPVEGQTLAVTDFQTLEAYFSAWTTKIGGLELVYSPEDAAEKHASEFEEIDFSARIIETKMNELLQLREFQKQVDTNSTNTIDSLLKGAVQAGLDLDEIERVQNKALQLKMAGYHIEKRIKRLIGQASELGYLLFDAVQQKVTLPDGKEVNVEAGTLYRKYQRIAKWTTTETVSHTIRKVLHVLFFKIPVERTIAETVQRQHSCVVDDYQVVDTSRDLLAEKVNKLRRQGLDVNVFRDTPQGYLSEDSVSLESVMEECGRSESVRQNCVVILPIYESSMSGERALVKYHVFKRPLPGVQPTAMPRLTMVESLSYRIAWQGTQLGELVSSLNLAPGESRTISMRKEYETETTVTETRSSVFDLDRQESTDLADEMENQVRREAEHSDETTMSLEAKVNYGFVSATANASHGSKNSLKNFSQGVNKIAKKSSQSVNRKQREEVSSTSTSRTKVSTYDETTAKVENINQGRTLNLMFYRLYNKFKSGLYVEGLKFQVLSSVEIIAGSGVQRCSDYTFDDFAGMVDEFRDIALPVRVSQVDKYLYLNNVLQTIDELIRNEYERVQLRNGEPSDNTPASLLFIASTDEEEFDRVVPREAFVSDADEKIRRAKAKADKKQADLEKLKAESEQIHKLHDQYVADRARIARDLKTATLNSSNPLKDTDQELLVVTAGLYLDATLGVQPGTEPYSEEMRAQRVRQEAADVALKTAEAQYKLALAVRLQRRAGFNGKTAHGNWITGVMPDPDSSTLQLRFRQPLEQGNWKLYVDGTPQQVSKMDLIGKYSVSFKLTDVDQCLARDDLISSVIELRDAKDGRLVSSVV